MKTFATLILALASVACFGQQQVSIADGASGSATPQKVAVKAASTAAVATDPALVVALSPNNGIAISATGSLNPCGNPGATLQAASGVTSGTTAVQIIALSGTTKVYVCSLSIIGVSGTTPTLSLVQGTGTNCATSQTTLLPAFGTTAGQLYAFANPVTLTSAGFALCYLPGGTTPVQNFVLTYVQQ